MSDFNTQAGSYRLGLTGLDWFGLVWTGVDWYELVWTGTNWCGLVWTGVDWHGLVWTGMDWCGCARILCLTKSLGNHSTVKWLNVTTKRRTDLVSIPHATFLFITHKSSPPPALKNCLLSVCNHLSKAEKKGWYELKQRCLAQWTRILKFKIIIKWDDSFLKR